MNEDYIAILSKLRQRLYALRTFLELAAYPYCFNLEYQQCHVALTRAFMWMGKAKQALGATSPYPTSGPGIPIEDTTDKPPFMLETVFVENMHRLRSEVALLMEDFQKFLPAPVAREEAIIRTQVEVSLMDGRMWAGMLISVDRVAQENIKAAQAPEGAAVPEQEEKV